MNTRSTITVALAVLTFTLTACSSTDGSSSADENVTGSVDSKASTTATPIQKTPDVSDEDKAKARKAAGLPPEPNATTRQAYLDALNAIDPRIIKPGKDDQAVSRGINQCRFITTYADDHKQLVQSTLERFTIDTRLPEIATPETGEKIVDVVHKHLCPDF